MMRSRPVRAALRTLAIGALGLTGLALLAACGSGGGGTATLPPGVSAGGAVTLPDDVTVTRPPEEDAAEAPPADDPIVESPAEDPIVESPAEDPTAEDPIVESPADDPGADDATDIALDEGATEEDVVWWPWVLGLLVIVIAVVAVVVSRSRRGNAAWSTRALSAMDASDALTTHLLAIPPEGLVVVARDDAQRLAELDVTTQELVRTAPDDRARGSIDAIRGPLVQLHAAVDTVALSPAPTPVQLTFVHQWANALHVATSTARSTLTTSSY